jgi:hypothetical protein
MKRVASFLLASGPLWSPPPPPRLRLLHSHLYSSPRRFPVESHLLLGCSHKIPNWTSFTSGLSRCSTVVSNTTLVPLSQGPSRHVLPHAAPRFLAGRAQRLVEFSQLLKHSSSSRTWYSSTTLRWTHTIPGLCIIIKQFWHDVPTWFKKQALRPPIYSSGALLQLVPTLQLMRHPYPQHCSHMKREVLVCFWVRWHVCRACDDNFSALVS